LEIKQRAQRGMAFLILTYIFVMAAKKLNFYGEKRDQIFVKNTKSKMRHFFLVFPSLFSQIKAYSKNTDCFEQLAKYANDPYHF